MNPCEQYREILAAYSPEGEEDRDLARHLETCPSCRTEFQSYLGLMEELKALDLPDPGELFFRSQLKRIESQIQAPSQRPGKTRRWWIPSLALAAAVVLLFIGFSRFRRQQSNVSPPEWQEALQFISEEEGVLPGPTLELDDLSAEQLDRLAKNIEAQIFQQEDVPEDKGDWDELTGPELDRFLQHLNEQTSRSNHEA